MIDLNIIVVNFKSRTEIAKLIPSILAGLNDACLSHQISVVDNSQNIDEIKNYLLNFGAVVKYVDALDNVGFGQGNNFGFKAIAARYHLLVNPDTVILPGGNTLGRWVKWMDANQKVAVTGPKLLYPDGSLQNSCYRFDRPSILVKPLKQLNWDKKYQIIKKYVDRLEMREFDHNETRPVDWVLGAAMMLRSEALRTVGHFDDRYFMYLEDCDLCQTCWQNGLPVYYLHDIAIVHGYERASASVSGTVYALLKNKLARAHLSSWIKYLWKWRKKHKYYAKLS